MRNTRPASGVAAAHRVILDALPVGRTVYVATSRITADDFYDVLDACGTPYLYVRADGGRLLLSEKQMEGLVDAGLAAWTGAGYAVLTVGGNRIPMRRRAPRPPDATRWTVTADATVGAVESVGAEALGYQPSVTQGHWSTVAITGRAAADKLVAALRAAGFDADLSAGWGA